MRKRVCERKHSEIIRTKKQLKRLAHKMKVLEEFAFDTETNTLEVYGYNRNFKLVDISISWGAYNNYVIPLGHVFDEDQLDIKTVRKYLKPIFEREDITLVGHHIKFDMHVLARVNIRVKTLKLFDTMIASWICDENSPNGLKDNSRDILGVSQEHFADTLLTVTKEEKKLFGLKASQKPTFDLVRIENGAPYALDDPFFTWELYLYYLDKLQEEGMEAIYYKTYPPFIMTLFNMEERGIDVDVPKLKQMGVDMTKDLEELEYQMLEIAGVQLNLGSTKQVAEILFGYVADPKPPTKKDKKAMEQYQVKLQEAERRREELKHIAFNLPIQSSTATGSPQVNASTLERLAKLQYKVKRKQEGVEFCKLLLEYKKLSKLKSAFVDGLLEQLYEDGKAHPSFNPIGTDSGRISCISEDTPITLVGEEKAIQDVKVGDKVYCYDDEGNLRISTVKRVIDNGIRPCIKINWSSLGTHDKGSLICTPDHKIRLTNGDWVRADSLTINTRLTHLRVSKKDSRPRIYGLDGLCDQEQLIIKKEWFKNNDTKDVIHHIDGDRRNNKISNLEIMTREEHTRYHSNLLVKEGRIKYDHLANNPNRVVLKGNEHGCYKSFTKEELEKMVIENKGIIRNIPMDFNTFKKKCKEVGYNYKETASKYQKQYVEVSKKDFEEAFFECKGVISRIQKKLNIGATKCKRLIKEYDLCYNHKVINLEYVGDRHVYDLEIEDYHNFIASEICVHNCSKPNLMQLPNAKDDDKYQIRDCFIGKMRDTGIRDHIISVD